MDLWEAMMPATLPEYRSEWFRRMAKETHDHGMQQGIVAGRADGLLVLLHARGCAVTDGDTARIRASNDIAELDRWIVRASSASTAADLFES